MAVDIKKLIAAISPEAYCKTAKQEEVNKIIKEALAKKDESAYLKAAEKAEPVEAQWMDLDKLVENTFKKPGLKNPIEQHTLEYDSFASALEPIYYWLHDYLYNKDEYGKAEKLIDNFISSPGSTHFSEMGMRATKMQEEAMKMLGAANTLIKSLLNIIYDLKEFELRLQNYDDLKSNDETKKKAAKFNLKQIWMDTVDIKRGNTSVKALALGGQAQFVTLIDAFMVGESLKDIEKLDLNERVKRVLLQRYSEFENWLELSEKELKKRFEIEKIYLRSQVNSLQLYARWAKPYLKAALQLEQRAKSTTALVTAFNTTLFELTLLGVGDYDPMKDVMRGDLPSLFKSATKKKYNPVILVELTFRSVPERGERGYGFRGAVSVRFTSFALTDNEIELIKNQIEKDDLADAMMLIGGATEESLEIIKSDLSKYLGEEKKEEKKEKSEENPFSSLFSIFTDFKKLFQPEEKKEEKKFLKAEKDSEYEKVIRSQAILEARKKCKKFYDAYKKYYGAPTF